MAFAHAAIADVTYKCVNRGGKVVYTDIALDQTCTRLGQTPMRSHQTRDVRYDMGDGATYDEVTARQIRNYRAAKAAEARAEQFARQQQELVDRENRRHEQEVKRQEALQKEVRRLSEQGRAGRNKARVLLGMEQEEDNQPPVVNKVNQGAINPSTGEYYAPAGSGYVDQHGTYYTPAGSNGVINTQTGEYSPMH
jgi:ATPase subunit of ABC transporter with duplicated ATPase domains